MVPHIRIPGLMEKPERHHTAKAQRGVVNAAVAVSISGGVYVEEVTGTTYPGCSVRAFKNKKGKPMRSMGTQEYIDFLERALEHMLRLPSFRRKACEALLVHDRNPVHKSKAVQDWLARKGINSMLAPPRSPDLMPLDYGVFGSIKLQLGKELPPTAAWVARASRFVALLRQAPSSRVILSIRERLLACVRLKGGHVEGALRKRGGR